MESGESQFQQLIREDRSSRENKAWRGKFIDYLELVKVDPDLVKLAHSRVYDVILAQGVMDIQESADPKIQRVFKQEPVKVYKFFADEFFGIEKVAAKIARYFHSASLKGEESRQVLYLMGPVGSGKSSLVEKLQHGLEASGLFYAIEDCPMSEEPLHLLPRHLRREFEKMLGVKIEGDLCPVCRFRDKVFFQAESCRHRGGPSCRSQQSGHIGSCRERRYLKIGYVFRGRSAGSRSEWGAECGESGNG
jgi:serine protein kinase